MCRTAIHCISGRTFFQGESPGRENIYEKTV